MNVEEIAKRSQAIKDSNPPYPVIYNGILFPAAAEPVVVPVPLDYECQTFVFLEDIRADAWVGLPPVVTTKSRKHAWRMEIDGILYHIYAWAQKAHAAAGGMVNTKLSPKDRQPRMVYGDILVIKESERKGVVELDENDFNAVRDRFRRWWAIHGADPDQVLS